MKDLLEHLGARALAAGFSALPAGAAAAAGTALGRLARRPLGVRREVVEGQIAAAFPDWPRERVAETAARCYQHFGRELAAVARMGRLEPGALLERTAGVEAARRVWRKAAAGGRGAVLVTGHLGNWELAGAAMAALGVPVSAVVKRQSNLRVDRLLSRLRRRLGVEPVGMAEAARRLPRALEEGRGVALVADQDAGPRGVFVPFLGRPASTFRGPARLSLRHDAPLLFGGLVREGEGYRLLLDRVEPPSGEKRQDPDRRERVRTGDPGAGPAGGEDAPAGDDETERALTRAWVERLEAAVRRRPAQYFWFHRRWKTEPGDHG